MPSARLTRRDLLLIGTVLAVSAVSITYIFANYTAAFPQASLNLKLTRDQITDRARQFLATQQLRPEGFRNLTLFDPDDDARVYLEREVGLERANRLMEGEVPVWRWRARWFRPPLKEEFVVQLRPDGALAGFSHAIPEAAAGARLSREAALGLAEGFLHKATSRPQRLIESQLNVRPARYDYTFTWEREGFRAGDATYRTTIVVQGDRIGVYNEGLHIPEAWLRAYQALRSRNELYAQIAGALYVPLVVAALAFIILAMRRHNIPWQKLILASAAVAGLAVINQWNQLPFFFDQMPTSSSFSNTLALGLLQALGAGVGIFFYVIIAAAAGEPGYRAMLPGQLSLPGILTRRGIHTKKFFLGTLVGYGFAAAHIAYVVAFYLIGRRFGVWSPQDVSYSDLVSTWLPWIYPLATALMAATSEEFWFRLFAIPVLKKLVRWTPLAIVIPAFVWGFLHANYPQEPAWIRGVEVGVIGVAAGLLMLRFGIISTLVWHYTVDAVLMGSFLFQSDNWYFRLSGLVVGGVVLFPLLVSLAYYRRNGGFAEEEPVLNSGLDVVARHAGADSPAAAPAGPEPEPEPAPETAGGLPSPRWVYLAAGVALLGGVLANPVSVGSWIRVGVTRQQAGAAADQAFRGRGQDPAKWMRSVQFLTNINGQDYEYLRQVAGAQTAQQTIRARMATGLWRVRYFQPQRREEWQVILQSDGRFYRIDHELDEKAAGPRLSPEEALQAAGRYMGGRVADFAAYRLVDSQQEKKDNRTDYAFTWEDTRFRVGEARARLGLELVGDEPSSFRRFLKLPEEWLRDFAAPRLQSFLLPGLLGAIGLPTLIVVLRRLSGHAAPGTTAHRYHWRGYLAVAAAGGGLTVASTWSGSALTFASYATSTPLENFTAQVWISRGLSILFFTLLALAAAMVVDVFWQQTFGPAPFRRPSIKTAVVLAVLLAGGGRLLAALGQMVPGPKFSAPLWQAPAADAILPLAQVLQQSFFGTLAALAIVGVVVLGEMQYLSRRGQRIFPAVVCVVVAATSARTPLQFVAAVLLTAVAIGGAWLVLRTWGGDLISYVVAFFWAQAASRVVVLAAQPEPWLRFNAAASAVVALAAGWWLIRSSRQRVG